MSLFSIFKDKLSKTSNILSFNILEILKNKKIDDLTLEELENVLISSDISLDVVNQLIDSIKKIKVSNDDGIKNVLEILAQNIENILLPREHVLINEKNDEKKILIFVGVNGSGKTTTIGKIANKILSNKKNPRRSEVKRLADELAEIAPKKLCLPKKNLDFDDIEPKTKKKIQEIFGLNKPIQFADFKETEESLLMKAYRKQQLNIYKGLL